MERLKIVVAMLGAAFGSLALFYIVFARASTLKDLGLSVEAQIMAQRIITPLFFVALGALAVSCEYFRRDRIQAGTKRGIFVGALRFIAVLVLPVSIVVCSLNTPFWSSQSPAVWDKPQFSYGWLLPWKEERSMAGTHMICPFLNLFFWTLYLMVLTGYRQIRHYLVMLGMMLALFGLYARFVGIKTIYREQGCKSSDGQLTAEEQTAMEGLSRPRTTEAVH